MSNTPSDETSDKGSVHVQIALDRSGSMGPIALATVDAISGFLSKQRKQPSLLRISLADFDSREPFRLVTDAIPIAEMMDLTPSDFEPRGGTPLLDAIGLAIERCDARSAAHGDEDQFLVIITDGHENASTDFTSGQIAALLDARQEQGWTVLFLGANQDSFDTGAGLNMKAGNVRGFNADGAGIKNAFEMTSDAISSHRSRDREERMQRKETLFDEGDRT